MSKTNNPNNQNTTNNITNKYFNFEIASTSTCNMACTYCFEGEELQAKKQQTPESISDIIQRLQTLLQEPRFNSEYPSGICINFWGGEPTLNFKWNYELIETIRNIPELDKKISYFIYSNGFNYRKLADHIDLFNINEQRNNKIRVQISYDGISNGREDHAGNPTHDKVGAHIKTFAINYPYLNLTTKATIQPQELLILETIWNGYYKLFQDIEKINQAKSDQANPTRTLVTFSPTLNYVDDFDDTNEEYLAKINIQFQKVFLLEQAFYKKYNFHLFGWFSRNFREAREKRLTNCSAGINLLALDYTGNISSCHGVLYSKNKEDFENFHDMNISNKIQTPEKFVTRFFQSRDALKQHTNFVSNECVSCEATVCYKCPVINIEQTEFHPNNYQKRDRRHCGIYKTFGRYDRVMISSKLQTPK